MKNNFFPLFIIASATIILSKIFYLQILDESYKLRSENISIKKVYTYPERGYLYDRNMKIMVAQYFPNDMRSIMMDYLGSHSMNEVEHGQRGLKRGRV